MRKGVILIPAAFALALCGCNETVSSSSAAEEKTPVQTTAVQTQPVGVREYSFPEFVRDKAAGDMLSNVINAGFDPGEAESFLETDPFRDYNCDRCLGGEYYTFYEDDFVGLLNSEGTVILNPDTYVQAEMVASDLIKLTYPAGSAKKAAYFQVGGGSGRFISGDDAFSAEIVTVSDGESGAVQYALSIRGNTDPAVYDSIEKVDSRLVETERKFREIYRASIGSRVYFLVLDDYLNLTVCEAPYARISFKIGGEYGQCFVLDGDDHSELLKMIQSFGSETMSVKPGKDEAMDYIRIESGISGGEKRILTMSPDGFCLTEGTAADGSINRFFTLYPKDTFVDLVNWVAEVAGGEYPAEEGTDSSDSQK